MTPILNVSSLVESFDWFARLGWSKCWDHGAPPVFGAVANGSQQIFLCENGQGGRDPNPPRFPGDEATGGVWMTWWVGTPALVDEACELARKNQMTVAWPPTDEPWGVREFHLRHPDGHTFRISSGLASS